MEATLQDILEARERRAARQQQLLGAYGRTLVCFTMNIAGPEKYSPLIAEGFRLGCERLTAQLAQFPILYSQRLPRHTGCEAFFVVDADPDTVKKRTVAIEEADDLGRLFDMDVFRPDGTRLERERERRCLLCGESAKVCGRSRAHSVQALQEATGAILTRAVFADRSRFVGEMAAKALLYAVGTTPNLVLWIGKTAAATGTWTFSPSWPAQRLCSPILQAAPWRVWKLPGFPRK